MKDLKHTPLFELANRLNQIEVEKQKLDIEWNQIVLELWDRIPTLQESQDIQPKKIKRLK